MEHDYQNIDLMSFFILIDLVMPNCYFLAGIRSAAICFYLIFCIFSASFKEEENSAYETQPFPSLQRVRINHHLYCYILRNMKTCIFLSVLQHIEMLIFNLAIQYLWWNWEFRLYLATGSFLALNSLHAFQGSKFCFFNHLLNSMIFVLQTVVYWRYFLHSKKSNFVEKYKTFFVSTNEALNHRC